MTLNRLPPISPRYMGSTGGVKRLLLKLFMIRWCRMRVQLSHSRHRSVNPEPNNLMFPNLKPIQGGMFRTQHLDLRHILTRLRSLRLPPRMKGQKMKTMIIPMQTSRSIMKGLFLIHTLSCCSQVPRKLFEKAVKNISKW